MEGDSQILHTVCLLTYTGMLCLHLQTHTCAHTIKVSKQQGVVVHVYNFSTGEVEAEGTGLKVNLSSIINSRPVWATQNPVLEHKRKVSIEAVLLHPGRSLVCSPPTLTFLVPWKSSRALSPPISPQPPSPPLKCHSLCATVYTDCI